MARKHIIAAIEAEGTELEFPKYFIIANYYRQIGKKGNSGVRITWRQKV